MYLLHSLGWHCPKKQPFSDDFQNGVHTYVEEKICVESLFNKIAGMTACF